jgi:hypothetical protein
MMQSKKEKRRLVTFTMSLDTGGQRKHIITIKKMLPERLILYFHKLDHQREKRFYLQHIESFLTLSPEYVSAKDAKTGASPSLLYIGPDGELVDQKDE